MTNAVTVAQGASNNVTFRNRIINGACVIDQRNNGASVTPSSDSYTVDRWKTGTSQTSKLTIQQNKGSVTPPAGFVNYLGVSPAATVSLGATDFFGILQQIEGYNLADLNWGSANAKAATMSFWVYSNITGTFGGSVNNSSAGYCYSFNYTISSANTWEYKTVLITGPTSGTWLTTNGCGAQVFFSLGTGATYSGTAGSWAASLSLGATGATSIMGSTSNYLYITGVQLEAGTTASPFEYRQYGTELALCQRYYYSLGGETAYQNINTVIWYGASECVGQFSYPVTMRAIPTVSKSGNWTTLGSGSGGPNLSGDQITTKNMQLGAYGGSGGTGGYGATLRANNDTSLRVTFSAEL